MRGEQTINALVLGQFAGEERRFRLTVPWLEKVERDCDAGPGVIAQALSRAVQLLALREQGPVDAMALVSAGLGDWRASYIRRPIFWGLVGGGLAEETAAKLVREMIDERGFIGLLEYANLAFRVITGAQDGPEDDPPGESEGAPAAAPKTTTSRRRSRTVAPATR